MPLLFAFVQEAHITILICGRPFKQISNSEVFGKLLLKNARIARYEVGVKNNQDPGKYIYSYIIIL